MTKPTASRVQNVRTPGAPATEGGEPMTKPTAEQLAQMDDEAAALEAQLLSGGDTEVSQDTVLPAAAADGHAPDIQALIAEGIRKGVAQALATQRKAQENPVPGAPLPDQSEVDAFSIKKEVLTQQGYVVPAQYPQPAGLPQALR